MNARTVMAKHSDFGGELVRDLLEMGPREWDEMNGDDELRRRIAAGCRGLTEAAFLQERDAALAQVHETLALIYDQDFTAGTAERAECETQPVLREIAASLERAMLESELRQIPPSLLEDLPQEGRKYVSWLKRIIADHDAAAHPLYTTYLKDRATPEDLRFHLAQETSLDRRFDDMVALIQIGTPVTEKMELAKNYWDEMGNGQSSDVHAELFASSLRLIDAHPEYVSHNLLLEAKISGNLSSCLALYRRHYHKAVGFFGVTEHLVPRRFKSFIAGWQRNGLHADGVRYHALHVEVDARHAAAWYENVVVPTIDRDPRAGRDIAIGTLIRLNSSKRYLDALTAHFEGAAPAPPRDRSS